MIESRKEVQDHLHNIQELAIREHLRKCEQKIEEMLHDIIWMATALQVSGLRDLRDLGNKMEEKYETRGI